jgi:probable F420-dependent oxidoreductase
MKVRIGIGAGGEGLTPVELEAMCDAMIDTGFDSIWIPEVLSRPGLDPMVALAWLAARLPTLKIGTTFLVPGRNVLRLARQLASLDHLSGGRLLLTAVPGLPRGGERTSVGVDPKGRGRVIEDTLPVLRSLLAGEPTDVPGPFGHTNGVVLDPPATQQPLEIWLGGSLPTALDRCGRVGDGWLPAMITPEACATGRTRIDEVAAESGRTIDPEHFGVSIGYSATPLEPHVVAALEARSGGADVSSVVPVGLSALRELLEAYLEVGFSKFVLRPLSTPAAWRDELAALAAAVGDLQT